LGNSSVSKVFAATSHESPLTHTWQIHMYCHRSSTGSSAACKIARTTCPTGRWRCVPHLQSNRELTLFGTPGTLERNGFFPRTIVAILVHKFQPYTFCRCLDRASPPCRTCAACLTDWAAGTRCGESPVPKHSGKRGERPELHPHTPNGGTTASTRVIPRQDACCTRAPLFAQLAGGADDELIINATGHERGIGGRMQLYARGGKYALFRKPGEARCRCTLQSPVGVGRKH
jgi:hypothetical protein